MAQTTMIVFDCATPAAPFPIAIFALDANGDGLFGYGKRYLERPDAFSIDPRHLPLLDKDQPLPRQPDGTYGVLSDAGPNAWGAKLTAYLLRKDKKPLPENPVEWFLQSKHFGSGCLAFASRPDEPPRLGEVPVLSRNLSARLLEALKSYLTDPDHKLDDETIQLLFPGSDLGGLRPKTIVMHDGHEHIAKFERPDDVPAAEYATLRLAHMAGINVPNFELKLVGNRSALLVERFDRTKDGQRIHYLSANSILRPQPLSPDQHEYKTSFSYAAIAEALRPKNNDAPEDAHELFRRMVLNIMVGNVDDHLRNHALLMREPGVFRLSPAFDICPHLSAPFHPQSIGVGAFGPASTIENALSQCGRFFLKTDEATRIIAQVKDVASTWRRVFADSGISEADQYRLAGCFAVADQATAVQVNLGRVVDPDDEADSVEAPAPAP
jgi:serine/threonine-protein kinase HipA